MHVRNETLFALLIAQAISLSPGVAENNAAKVREEITGTGPAVLWRDPIDIASRDLYYGSGGKDHAPAGTFQFVKEDLDGTSPKFQVVDEHGVKWKVKLGPEARSETVASRITWAVGYFTNEDYFVQRLDVRGMPVRLQRGQKLLGPDDTVRNVRLKRQEKGEKKLGNWEWRHDGFEGTREWNGLKVVMALINNWDLKDENNAIYQNGRERVFMVSDLGASFGSAGRSWPKERAKDNFNSYRRSRFIRRITADSVDFEVPARPSWVLMVNPKEYLNRVHLEWIGRNVPRSDVHWMGQLLARLSPQQIRDAFRASGYSPQEVESFAGILEERISQLKRL